MSLEDNKKYFKKVFKTYLKYGKIGDKILDFGCGEGYSTLMGKEMGLEVIGLDLDPKYIIKESQCDPNYNVKIIKAEEADIRYYDGKRFPFPDNYFNGMTAKVSINKDFTVPGGNCIGGNYKVLHRESALNRIKEIYRVLKNNSIVIIILHSTKLFTAMENLLTKEERKNKNLTVIGG